MKTEDRFKYDAFALIFDLGRGCLESYKAGKIGDKQFEDAMKHFAYLLTETVGFYKKLDEKE